MSNHSRFMYKEAAELAGVYARQMPSATYHEKVSTLLDFCCDAIGCRYALMALILTTKSESGEIVRTQRLAGLHSNVYRDIAPRVRVKFPLTPEAMKSYIFSDSQAIYLVSAYTEKPYWTDSVTTDPHQSVSGLACPFQPPDGRFKDFLSYPLFRNNGELFAVAAFICCDAGSFGDVVEPMAPLMDVLATCYNSILLGEERNELRNSLTINEAAKISAESLVQAKSAFLANMSHELRTPLNGVVGMLSLLSASELSQMQRTHVDTCLRSAQALTTVLNDVLLFSKAEAGAIKLESVPFSVHTLVEDLMLLATNSMSSKRSVDVVHYIDPKIPDVVRGDPARLRQILLNLVGNAVKFTSVGEVALELTLKANKLRVDHRDSAEGDVEPVDGFITVHVEVSDTGCGMTKEEMGRIFKPFEQGDASTTRRYGGTGLGLAIVQRLLPLFYKDGSLHVESRPGRGSTFSFDMQLVRAGADAAMLAQVYANDQIGHDTLAEAEAALSGKRLLVIDDSAVNCQYLLATLRHIGADCVTSRDAVFGLDLALAEALRGKPFDCIILDHSMPIMNGLEVAELLRKSPAMAETPVLMLSSAGDLKTITLPDNVVTCVSKPIQRAPLIIVTARLLDSKSRSAMWTEWRQERSLSLPNSGGRRVSVTSLAQELDVVREAPIRKIQVLEVEDDVTNRLVMCSLLESKNVGVHVASNGAVAVDKLGAQIRTMASNPAQKIERRIDCVLMDIHMPIMDGLEATRRIRELEREHGAKAPLPVIAVTADVLSPLREEYAKHGFSAITFKPAERTDLIELIETHVRDYRQQLFAAGAAHAPASSSESEASSRAGKDTDSGGDERNSDEHYAEETVGGDDDEVAMPFADTVLLNVEALDHLEGDPQMRITIMASFAIEGAKMVAELEELRETLNRKRIRDVAHKLKGSAAVCGAVRLSECCKHLQMITTARDGETSTLVNDADVGRVRSAIRDVSRVFTYTAELISAK